MATVIRRENFLGDGQAYETVYLDTGESYTFDHEPTDAEIAAQLPRSVLESSLRSLAVEARALQWAADLTPGDTASQALADQAIAWWRTLRDAWAAKV